MKVPNDEPILMRVADAIRSGRTVFPRNVSAPGVHHRTGNATPILKRVEPHSGNKKMHGGVSRWTKGLFKGMPLYALTLEERVTCPSDCHAWDICYGSRMPFATRFDVVEDGGRCLMDQLELELDALDSKWLADYSLRLHVLGDFFSLEYVDFWQQQLAKRPLLHVFGYSHRSDGIGEAVAALCEQYKGRWQILRSTPILGSHSQPVAMLETDPGADKLPTCPEQTKRVTGCMTCGLCTLPWIRGVTFKIH